MSAVHTGYACDMYSRAVLLFIATSACTATSPAASTIDANDTGIVDANDAGIVDASGWNLTWSDEFALPDGSAVDPTKWSYDVGGGGWGNNERQYYVTGTASAAIQNGALVITATTANASKYTCWYGVCSYTSARLTTKGKFAQKFGRFEARLKIPAGQGLWSAFWMLGDNIDTPQGRWPACGEIDIMENVGHEPTMNHGTIHGTGYSGAKGIGASYTEPNKGPLSNDFHIYATEWDATAIRFYVDATLYATRTRADVPDGGPWPFDHPFFLVLNIAVGGDWPKDPDSTTTFPQTLTVDWVRVYQKL